MRHWLFVVIKNTVFTFSQVVVQGVSSVQEVEGLDSASSLNLIRSKRRPKVAIKDFWSKTWFVLVDSRRNLPNIHICDKTKWNILSLVEGSDLNEGFRYHINRNDKRCSLLNCTSTMGGWAELPEPLLISIFNRLTASEVACQVLVRFPNPLATGSGLGNLTVGEPDLSSFNPTKFYRLCLVGEFARSGCQRLEMDLFGNASFAEISLSSFHPQGCFSSLSRDMFGKKQKFKGRERGLWVGWTSTGDLWTRRPLSLHPSSTVIVMRLDKLAKGYTSYQIY